MITRRMLRPSRLATESSRYLVLVVCALTIGYPIYWMVQQSFKSKYEMYANAWGLPSQIVYQNFTDAISAGMLRYILNSVFVSAGAVVIVLICACLAAYSFSKFKFRGGIVLFYMFVFTLIVPAEVLIIPLYSVVSGLKLANTYMGLMFPYAAGGLPISIFFLKAFFDTIPTEIEEAAKVDGCSNFGVFWRIVLPISGPGLATIAILQFITAWNEFVLALIFVQSPDLRTIPLALMMFQYSYSVDWGPLFASLSMATVPIIVVYVLMQRQFIQGLTAGAIKG